MASYIPGSMPQNFTSNNYNMNYPTEAPSYEDATNPKRRLPSTSPDLTPYLGLRARLSQVWFNRWTVLLMLVLVRLILAARSLDNDMESARAEALSACTGVESMGSAMASMPHYMSAGVNELAASGVEAGVRALEESLLMVITGIQEIVVFVVDLIRSTYVCLITLAITGSLSVVLDATEKIADFINGTLNTIFDDISGSVDTFDSALKKITDKLNTVPTFFGSDIKVPTLSIPSLDKLKNVKIPSDFDTKLDEIKAHIPTFEEVKEAADNAIRIPFQAIAKHVNESMGVYEFDRSVLPVPDKKTLTFCSDNPSINNFFDGLEKIISEIKKILIVIIIILAVLAMIPMAYREIWNWRSTRSRAYMIVDPDHTWDPIDIVVISSRPLSSTVGLKLSNMFKSARKQVLVRWAVAYVTTTPALFVLSLGVAGLASALSQYILLKQVEKATPALAAEVGQFADIIVKQLTAASTAWAVKTNEAINNTNTEFNNEVFGWVVNGTDAVNNTLTVFVDEMYKGVDTLFNGTPFANPIKDVLDCLIGLKVKGIQAGLTWAHDHAHINFPHLPNDTFSLGAENSIAPDAKGAQSFLSDTSSVASDKITNVVVKLTKKWESMLKQEAIISGCVIAVWLVVCLIALIRTFVLCFGRDKVHGDRGIAPIPPVRPNGLSPRFPSFGRVTSNGSNGSGNGSGSSNRSRGIEEVYVGGAKVDPDDYVHMGSVNSRVALGNNQDHRRSMYGNVHPALGTNSRGEKN